MKNKTIKRAIVLGILSMCGVVNAQNTGDIKVSAEINAGCKIVASDIAFGLIEVSKLVSAPMNIRCSKNTVVNIEAKDKNNPGQHWGPRMWRVGATTDKPETRIRYAVSTYMLEPSSALQIISRPRDNYLWISATKEFMLTVKFLNTENVELPFKGVIEQYDTGVSSNPTLVEFKPMQIVPGDYTDELIYVINF